jgi:Fur family ferric uptake transcriptional regulator
MSSSGAELKDIARALRAKGLRMTPQRRLVLRLLHEQGGHLSADELYRLARQRQPRISLSTVYRALDVFEELGLVRALHLEGEHHRYEIARDGAHPGREHQHMICLGCNRVIEFECGHCAETHQDLAERYGFQITGSRVQLLGYCADCRARGEGSEH